MKKSWLLALQSLFQKCFIKTKAFTRIRLLCGIITEIDANNYGLGLKRASLRKSRVERLSYFLIGFRVNMRLLRSF